MDGDAGRDSVITVLQTSGVVVRQSDTGTPHEYVLSKGDRVETKVLYPRVKRRMLHYLSRQFSIGIHLFYHPEWPATQSATDEEKNSAL